MIPNSISSGKRFRVFSNFKAAIRAILLATSLPGTFSVLLASTAQTNIVLIVADDLGWGDLGCYGSKANETPHIDALAASGIRFTDFHSSGPMCTPTRVSILTGQYQQRFGAQFDGALSGVTQRDEGLPRDTLTLARILSEAGYATACFGKWHLGYQPPWLPASYGFDEFRGLASGDGDFHTQVDRGGRQDWWNGNQLEQGDGYTTDLLTDYAVEFIERNHNASKPFFLYLPHLAIHFPWQGPDDPPHRKEGVEYFADKWGIIPNPANVAPHINAMIRSLDDSVGRVVAALDEAGIRNETLVIFTSDNGGYLTYGKNFRNISSNGPFRGQKAQLYEGGHRVPAIFSQPGTYKPAVTDALGHSNDFFPTIAAVAEISHDSLPLDGRDLGPLLNQERPLPETTLYWRMKSLRAVRHGPWKLTAAAQKTELFRLDRDPGETTNLAESEPEMLQLLDKKWENWNRDVNASAKARK